MIVAALARWLRDARLMAWLGRNPRDWSIADEPCACGCGNYALWIHSGTEIIQRALTPKQRTRLLALKKRAVHGG